MESRLNGHAARAIIGNMLMVGLVVCGAGCGDDDCLTCAARPPIAPTMVFSVAGDERVTVFWNDYPEYYCDRISGYYIWRRDWQEDDALDPSRQFDFLGSVDVGDNHDPVRGQYHYVDQNVVNGRDYEYAVSSVARHGESYLSFELVIATPLPGNAVPLALYNVDGPNYRFAGFDFSLAAMNGSGPDNDGVEGIVDPTAEGNTADIQVRFVDGIAMLETLRPGNVRVQDAGAHLDADNQLYFDGVYWAPEEGYSATGVMELIVGHIYIFEIADDSLHYAKLGVTHINDDQRSVRIMWAYQLVPGLPWLAEPWTRGRDDDMHCIGL